MITLLHAILGCLCTKNCHLNDDYFGEGTFVVAPGSVLLLSPTVLG
jgi:hypothetical protein